jgi:hypothetical protein
MSIRTAFSSKVKEYATGAAQRASQILPVANFLAPTVDVATARFRYTVYSQQNAFRLPNLKRGIGGAAAQLQTGGSETLAELQPYAIDAPLDEFEMALEGDDLGAVIMDRADDVAQLAALNWSNEVISAALTSVGAGTNKSTASVDLIDAIDEQVVAVMKASRCGASCPIKVLIGPSAMRRLKNNTQAIARFTGQTRSGRDPGLSSLTTDQAMSLVMGNPKFEISWITYDSADEGATASPSFMLDTAVLIFTGADAPTRHDPSFMKTFRLRNKWMVPGTYKSADQRQDIYKFDWYALPVVTNSAAVARLNFTA